jgi:integrase/recombinase XerD
VYVESGRSTSWRTSRGKNNVCTVIWQALEHARRHGRAVAALPPRPTFPRQASRAPYVLTDDEISRLLGAAKSRRMRRDRTRATTYAALFGLLLVTGLRVGEALALDVQDVDLNEGLITVRAGKFRKSRVLPLSQSTLDSLETLAPLRGRPRPALERPLFVSGRGTRLLHAAVTVAFRRAITTAGVQDRDGRRPRIHDLRHSFAVRTVVDWLKKRRDPAKLLALLATYMGHVGPSSTQAYLRPNHQLLTAAARRFESTCAPRRRQRGA